MTHRVLELWPHNGRWGSITTLFHDALARVRPQMSTYVWCRVHEFPWWERRLDRITFTVGDALGLELSR